MIRTWSSRCLSHQLVARTSSLAGFSRRCGTCCACSATAYSMRCVLGQGDADLVAVGLGDPALLLQDLPRHVVLLRADQGEDVVLAAVLAHQRGGQAEPAPRLDLGGDAEDRRRQQVHLVVDDQAPVALVEQVEVGELRSRRLLVALAAIGEDLVGGDGDRPDLLALAGVLADHRRGRASVLSSSSSHPLAHGHDVGASGSASGSCSRCHGADADDGLAGAAGQHDDAAAAAAVAAGVEDVHRLALVVAQGERQRRRGVMARRADRQRRRPRRSRPGPRPG